MHHSSSNSSRAIAVAMPANPMQRAVDITWCFVVAIGIFLAIQFMPSFAFATTSKGTIAGVICGVATGLSTETGPIIGTIAIAVLGIGALFGKTSWTMALTTAVGIAVLIGANSVLELLFPTDYKKCSSAGTNIELTQLNTALCGIAMSLTGTKGYLANALASMGILIIGFSAFFGRISWGPAIAVGVAIGIIFGAGNLMTEVYVGSKVCKGVGNNVKLRGISGGASSPTVTNPSNPGVTGPSGIETPEAIEPTTKAPVFNAPPPAICRLDPSAPGC